MSEPGEIVPATPDSPAQSAETPTEKSARFPSKGDVIPSGLRTYTIGDPIGRGAYGIAYECTDDWGNEVVAKVLFPTGTYDEVRGRFNREFRGLVTLRHPNITYIHDAFERENTFYIVIERCTGSLADLFTFSAYNGYLWFMPVARCVLQAIEFIHLNNLVHRDLHPRNVLYSFVRNEMVPTRSESLTFKVADLGISRVETADDLSKGTFADWMIPPEVLDPITFGAPGKQVDIYHAALLLMAVISGRDLAFTTEEILDGAPRKAAEKLGGRCGAPLARALRRHVADRTSNALEFWKDLVGSGCNFETGPGIADPADVPQKEILPS